MDERPDSQERRPSRSSLFPWYDSEWLAKYVAAKRIIRSVRPEAFEAFLDAFRVLQTDASFRVKLLEKPFDDQTLDQIRRVVRSLRPADLELHEARAFGRFVVHDHPYFNRLQQRIAGLVSAAVGESVEASYNFLSLYGSRGVCPLHIDSPEAKWTFDLCIDQSAPWPICFSQVLAWPGESDLERWPSSAWEHAVRRDPALNFTSYTLMPGQALVFSGSSQWHFRDPLPARQGRQFCDLLFFHYIPAGAAQLVQPKMWAQLFGVPELSALD
jgi:hypothetical protein